MAPSGKINKSLINKSAAYKDINKCDKQHQLKQLNEWFNEYT